MEGIAGDEKIGGDARKEIKRDLNKESDKERGEMDRRKKSFTSMTEKLWDCVTQGNEILD